MSEKYPETSDRAIVAAREFANFRDVSCAHPARVQTRNNLYIYIYQKNSRTVASTTPFVDEARLSP